MFTCTKMNKWTEHRLEVCTILRKYKTYVEGTNRPILFLNWLTIMYAKKVLVSRSYVLGLVKRI